MYEDDEIEKWRRGARSRMPRDKAVSFYSEPCLTASLSMSASSHSTPSQRSLPSSSSRCSWRSRCVGTSEYCAAGHELVQIPVLDRQRYLQRKEMLLRQRENQRLLEQHQCIDPYDVPIAVNQLTVMDSAPASIVIECDCCSRIISNQHFIAGCCLECDIDVCKKCFKNGQSYIDVISKESREDDLYDEHHQEQQQRNYHHSERYDGCRPTYMGTGRMNYDDYPDPTVFQWAFTGSSNDEDGSVAQVEYFEKDFGAAVGVIRLDFYYTIGTVQTTIVDPVRGTIRELFTKSRHKMSVQSYRKILKDPLSYNNERYKKGTPTSYDVLDYHLRRQHQQVL